MKLSNLTAISPLDGRYAEKTEALRNYFSEYALIKYRVIVELCWFSYLTNEDVDIEFSEKDALKIKQIEKKINHDVKAVEYFVKSKIKNKSLQEWVHWGCTSDDVNNLAYGLMLKEGVKKIELLINNLIKTLTQYSHHYANTAMLSRTHGQKATPTTVGKEFANYVSRLTLQKNNLEKIKFYGKFNGAVGNFNAHKVVFPEKDWPKLIKKFVEDLGLTYQAYTTQIEPHDYMAEIFHHIIRINNILVDLCRDCWGYISWEYFSQKSISQEVGSSTMPHKINPIDFENAEGNLYLSNSILNCLSEKLPISRFQRDLVDSTLLRNIGVGLGYAAVAYQSVLKGLNKIEMNKIKISEDLDQAWEVLAEPIQMVLRAEGIEKAYEKLKLLTRGKKITKEILHKFIDNLDLSENIKNKLKKLTPKDYVGYAEKLARGV